MKEFPSLRPDQTLRRMKKPVCTHERAVVMIEGFQKRVHLRTNIRGVGEERELKNSERGGGIFGSHSPTSERVSKDAGSLSQRQEKKSRLPIQRRLNVNPLEVRGVRGRGLWKTKREF